MSPTLLSARLKHLIKSGVIEHSGQKGNSSYQLTQAGRELRPLVELLGVWGHRWAQSDLKDGDLDAGLLMWDMRRSVDPSVFPTQQIVVQFEFTDAEKGAKDWWLISKSGEVDLCLKDPGYDIDILVRSSLRVFTEIWICQKGFAESAAKGEISIIGDPKLTGCLQDWLRSSGLSRLGAMDIPPIINWGSS